jgi:asparagine synthase (glutamine-hydrolysing)
VSGIFALIASSDDGLRRTVDKMADRLRPTPYVRTSATRLNPAVAIGTATLGILPWEPACPVWSADGTIGLWMVGEFFHHDERLAALNQTTGNRVGTNQARFALELYLHEGPEGIAALSGTFQIVIWDARTRDLILINDRIGFYPHYVFRRGRTLVLSPSLAAMLAVPDVPAVPDDIAIAQFLRFQKILGDRTWLEDVSLLPPASIVRFCPDDGTFTSHRYWDWDRIRPLQVRPDEAIEESSAIFDRAVQARMARGSTALLLSGGLDSRLILAFVRDPSTLLTVTYGAPDCLDVETAGRIARVAGSPHEWTPYENGQWVAANADCYFALTDGFQAVIHSHGLTSMAALRDRTEAIVTGWGGGTAVGGYLDEYEWDHRYRATVGEEPLTRIMYEAFCARITWPGLTDAEADALTDSPRGLRLRGLAFDSFRTEFERTQHVDPAVRLDGFYIEQHERRATEYMNVMARGFLEARAPFKDDALVEYFFGLPETIRRTPQLVRGMLHRQSPALTAIPYERDGLPPHPSSIVRLGHRAVRRAKRTWLGWLGQSPQTRLYADYEQYLRTDMRSWAEELLLGARTKDRGLFEPRAVAALWQRHLSGRELWTIGKIMPLITIEQAMRRLCDDGGELSNRSRNQRDEGIAVADSGRDVPTSS